MNVRMVDWIDGPDKGDAADVVGGGGEMRRIINAAVPYVGSPNVIDTDRPIPLSEELAEPPRPLFRPTPEAQDFPTAALGPALQPVAEAIARRVQAHPAIVGQAVLATAALAVQPHADVGLPFGQRRPLSLFLMTAAESGERKSSADYEASLGIQRRETELRERYKAECDEFENRLAVWESERRRITRSGKMSGDEKNRLLDELGSRPTAPCVPMLTCPEPTLEGLVQLLSNGFPSLGLFSDEGAQFVGGFAMSKDHWMRSSAALNSIWDGSPIRRVRRGDGASVLVGRRLSMHLLLQPTVAPELLANPQIEGIGFLARILPTAPPSLAGTRAGRISDPSDAEAITAFGGQISALLRLKPSTRPDGALEPRLLRLTEGAQGMWQEFADSVELQMGNGSALNSIKGFAAKMAEHAARLGSVLQLVENLEAPMLDADHLKQGIELIEYYATEWLRLQEAYATRPNLLRAERLGRWLLEDWPETVIGLREVYQLGPPNVRDARTARATMRILEEHGWVTSLLDGAMTNRGFRQEAWWIRSEAQVLLKGIT